MKKQPRDLGNRLKRFGDWIEVRRWNSLHAVLFYLLGASLFAVAFIDWLIFPNSREIIAMNAVGLSLAAFSLVMLFIAYGLVKWACIKVGFSQPPKKRD